MVFLDLSETAITITHWLFNGLLSLGLVHGVMLLLSRWIKQ